MVVQPIKSVDSLPRRVKAHLPPPAQTSYMQGFNRAWEGGFDPQRYADSPRFRAHCHKAAWDEVKARYTHDPVRHEWVAGDEGALGEGEGGLPPAAAGDAAPTGKDV